MKNNEKCREDIILGEIIKNRRIQLKMTQTQLAKLSNTTDASISRYENAERTMFASTFFSICDVLGLDCNEVAKEVLRRMNEK